MIEKNELVLFKSKDGDIEIPVRMEAESMWLTRMQMAELFDVTPQNITLHIRNVYKSGELEVGATSKESLLVQDEGGRSFPLPIARKADVEDFISKVTAATQKALN